jgi:very-short-patch-repair endonuclease
VTAEPLSPEWQRAFSVREAVEGGIPSSRLRGRDLRREFHGSRIPRPAGSDLATRCAALQVLLDDRHAFTGITAARLWGMPLPRRLEEASRLHVASADPTRAIRHRGVEGSKRPASWRVADRGGLRLHAPVETWASLARVLRVHDLVAVVEFLVTRPSRTQAPLADSLELTAFVASAGGMTGIGALRAAAGRTRVGARSRPETLLRLLLEDSGLPPARINEEYLLRGRVAIPDLSWPEYLVAVEYDGGYHREAGQFVRDLIRTDELVDEGWLVVHVVAAQLYGRPTEIVARVMQRLASRGASLRSVTRFATFEP